MKRRHAALLLLSWGAAACSGRQTALPAPGASNGASAARPEEACVPTGPERCFDARDDNCNGLIDEGCGVPSGLVQFVIAWDAPTADVDLLVSDPRGELAEVGRRTATGLVKDRDCPGRKQDCAGKNYENVYLDREEAKRGPYRVKIRLERLEDEDVPIAVTLGARIGPKTYSAELSLIRAEDTRELVFVL
ncbi:MAG TPA: hypothetical protein VHC69_12550 [Polyangiaceae bacterium]|nr:hypothetical protein [Polyangiaceae bacterium]